MGGLRWTIAGALLAAFVLARGETLPPPSRWGGILLLGFLLLGLGNGGVVFAEQWVPSGLAAVLVATSPFWMAGVEAALKDGEKLRRNTVLGLLIGFSGILVLVWPLSGGRGGPADRIVRLGSGIVILAPSHPHGSHPRHDGFADAGRRADHAGRGDPAG
jgi:drug/metabolite transporter (DMT)-like permease